MDDERIDVKLLSVQSHRRPVARPALPPLRANDQSCDVALFTLTLGYSEPPVQTG